jgi:hypothetical protein
LKAITEIRSCKLGELRGILKLWLGQASPKIRTQAFETNWEDFRDAWRKCRLAKGDSALADAIQKARASDVLPEQARDYQDERLQLLAKVCRELQTKAGGKPFFLPVQVVEKHLGIPARTVSRWRTMLCDHGILEQKSAGEFAKRRAAEFLYVADRPGNKTEPGFLRGVAAALENR